jgi:hypothetical protein
MEGGSGKGRNRAVVAGRNRPEALSGRNWRAGCRHPGLEHGVPSGVELRVAHSAGHTMRTIIAFAAALLSSAALADTVRHVTVPERLWGTWAPSADLCPRQQVHLCRVGKRVRDVAGELRDSMGH